MQDLLEPAPPAAWWEGRAPLSVPFLQTNFPCRSACPVGTNAGGYVSLIAHGKYQEAYALARGPNPFASVCGRICAHPCEAACRRAEIDSAISIRALKRFVTERHGVESARSFEDILRVVERPRPPAPRPARVAVVGAGPAGLSCAHDLALMGHRVTVFEASKVTGGMLRLGVPEYRLPREVLQCDVDFVAWLGVEIRTGVEIGRDVPFETLARGHDAVFLAPGCRRGVRLKIPGADLPGVLTAVDFLAAVNIGAEIEIGERVVVVGGGNVAFDAARSARRFGGTSLPDEEHHHLVTDAARVAARVFRRQVTVLALESAEEMPSEPREIVEGAEEGIRVIHRRGPKAILGNGKIRALQTLDVARVFDEQRRFAPEFIPGTEKEIETDTVILAVGQVADLSFLGADHGLEVTPRNLIAVDRPTLATSRPGVYAGGDVAFGPRIAIEAVADGRRAARAIDTFLTGRTDPAPRYRLRIFESAGYNQPFSRGDYEKIPRREPRTLPILHRAGPAEVELAYSEGEARREGSRCLHCWVNTVFDSSAMQGTECIQCGGCVDVCPEQCIDLVSLLRVAGGDDGAEPLRLPDGSPVRIVPTDGRGAALIKDETACIRCGLCARRCPTGCITMQAFYREDEMTLLRGADSVL